MDSWESCRTSFQASGALPQVLPQWSGHFYFRTDGGTLCYLPSLEMCVCGWKSGLTVHNLVVLNRKSKRWALEILVGVCEHLNWGQVWRAYSGVCFVNGGACLVPVAAVVQWIAWEKAVDIPNVPEEVEGLPALKVMFTSILCSIHSCVTVSYVPTLSFFFLTGAMVKRPLVYCLLYHCSCSSQLLWRWSCLLFSFK